jgi:BlaI family transcriptional regulator, penicillinase repressor
MARPRSEHPTAAEFEVLQVLWAEGSCTVRQVMDVLNRSRHRAYTSVMSLLNVMVDKGLVRREPQGRAFLYAPRIRRQSLMSKLVGDLLDRAFAGSAEQLVAHALDQAHPTSDELDAIEHLIDSYRTRKEQQ